MNRWPVSAFLDLSIYRASRTEAVYLLFAPNFFSIIIIYITDYHWSTLEVQ